MGGACAPLRWNGSAHRGHLSHACGTEEQGWFMETLVPVPFVPMRRQERRPDDIIEFDCTRCPC